MSIELIDVYMKDANGNYEWMDCNGKLIRCKDCNKYEVNGIKGYCCLSKGENWFCADARPKEDEEACQDGDQ